MTNNTKIQTLINTLAKELDQRDEAIARRQRFLHQSALDQNPIDYPALELELAEMKASRSATASALRAARDIRDDEFEVCDFQVLNSDFDYAMASPGQTGRCKLEQAHNAGHDVRTR